MSLTIAIPSNAPPGLMEVARLYQEYSKLKQSPYETKEISSRCTEIVTRCTDIIRSLISEGLNDPFQSFITSLYAVSMVGNVEFSALAAATALHMKPDLDTAKAILIQVLPRTRIGGAPEAYFELTRGGGHALWTKYMDEARRFYEDGRYCEADDPIQAANALRFPTVTPLPSCPTIRSQMNDVNLEEIFSTMITSKYEYWEEQGNKDLLVGFEERASDPDRMKTVEIVCGLAEALDRTDVTCLDFGCGTGAMLQSLHERMARTSTKTVHLHGIEYDQATCDMLKMRRPFAAVQQGTPEDVLAGRVSLPDRIDVFFTFTVFLIMHPDTVAALLTKLEETTRYLVIGDDAANVDGSKPLPRHTVFFLHNYGDMLNNAGFEIESIDLAASPSRGWASHIVARNRRHF